jgi:hypothetical protein
MSFTRLPDDLSDLKVDDTLFIGNFSAKNKGQLVNDLISDELFVNFLYYAKARFGAPVARDILYTSCHHLIRELDPSILNSSNIMKIILVAALTREVQDRGGKIENNFGSDNFWGGLATKNINEAKLNDLLKGQWKKIQTEVKNNNIELPNLINIPSEFPMKDVDVRQMLTSINKPFDKTANKPKKLARRMGGEGVQGKNSTARIQLDIPIREEIGDRVPPPLFAARERPAFMTAKNWTIKILDIQQTNVLDYGGHDLVKKDEKKEKIELKPMTEKKLEAGTIEFQCKSKGLEYSVMGPNNEIRTRLVPWKDLPKFPKDADLILKRKNELLPILVRETMKVGDTQPSYKSLLNITITRDGKKETLKNIDMGLKTTIMTQAIDPAKPDQKKPAHYFNETKNTLLFPGIDGFLHKIDLNKKNPVPERMGDQHTTEYVRKNGETRTHGSYVTSVGILKFEGQEKTISSSAECVYIWDQHMKNPEKIQIPGSRVIKSVVGLNDGYIACTDRAGQLYVIGPNKQIYKCGRPQQVIKEKLDRRGRQILDEHNQPKVEKELLNNLSIKNGSLHQSNGLKEGVNINVGSLLENIKNNKMSPMKIERPINLETNNKPHFR